MMSERDFKDNYVVIFTATYTANHYDDNCLNNKHDTIVKHAILEDAIFIAEYAWKEYKNLWEIHDYCCQSKK